MLSEKEALAQVVAMCKVLDKRTKTQRKLSKYDEGGSPVPEAVVRARMTKAYRLLVPMAEAPWGKLIVDSIAHRLQVIDVNSSDENADVALWKWWMENFMGSEHQLAIRSALRDGRAFALAWPGGENGEGEPECHLEDCTQMVIKYEEGSRHKRVAALRRWIDEDDLPHATLYTKEALYKFSGPKNSSGQAGTQWVPRVPETTADDGGTVAEEWPLTNPFNVVPAVEIAVNRRLKSGAYGSARGEYEDSTGLIDRINLLTFLGLVVALWMGFPLRGVVGMKLRNEILKDDQGKPIIDPETNEPKESDKKIPPFDADADSVFAIANKDARLEEFKAADRSNLSILEELEQLAVVTHTPRHYFPMKGGTSNVSADGIRAFEGPMHGKAPTHKESMGEGFEEFLRVVGVMMDTEQLDDNGDPITEDDDPLRGPVTLPRDAEMQWADHESRSLAERADAAGKLKDIIPPIALAEKVLNATPEEVRRWRAMEAGDGFQRLLDEAAAELGRGAQQAATTDPEPPVS